MSGWLRWMAVLALAAVSALGANFRLYLKDGGNHLVREYKVEGDRVRYYSVERSDWEEVPLELVDLKKTEQEIKARTERDRADAAAQDAEDKAERAAEEEISRVPGNAGAYYVAGNELKPLAAAEMKLATSTKRTILKIMTPVPLVTGKARIELDGEQSAFVVNEARPEFYFRLALPERFGILKLTRQKGNRVAGHYVTVPVSNETFEEITPVDVFRRQVSGDLYKVWPVKPLEPGEYAVFEYTEGKTNLQLWDFSWRGGGGAAR